MGQFASTIQRISQFWNTVEDRLPDARRQNDFRSRRTVTRACCTWNTVAISSDACQVSPWTHYRIACTCISHKQEPYIIFTLKWQTTTELLLVARDHVVKHDNFNSSECIFDTSNVILYTLYILDVSKILLRDKM